jgi:sortase (surface protein transpeptidase)
MKLNLPEWRSVWDPESEVLVLTLTAAVLAGVGIALILMGAMPATTPGAQAAPPAPRLAAEVLAPAETPTRSPSHTPAPAKVMKKALGRSVPLRLNIPGIDVHTSLISLGLQKDGTVQVPPLKGNAPAGWYKGLSTPGEAGASVILGHVDSAKDGPAVFYRLRDLRPGMKLSVDRADGRTVSFVVRSVARYSKKDFPTSTVYGDRPGAELRLVTCGGSFDALRRSYRDNIVVYAAMTGSTRTPKGKPAEPKQGKLIAGR